MHQARILAASLSLRPILALITWAHSKDDGIPNGSLPSRQETVQAYDANTTDVYIDTTTLAGGTITLRLSMGQTAHHACLKDFTRHTPQRTGVAPENTNKITLLSPCVLASMGEYG